ncbi:helix-hairpin-helix domain-containing protein [Oligoflexia bacterium]|nr:helix-hairpin-helix domain-containing protein [Oligoflexia bacterium]
MTMTKVYIDYRERRAQYVNYLADGEDLEISYKQLSAGDIWINGLGIERKTVRDFFLTLREGRLFKQLGGLKRTYSRQLLLIEGRGIRRHLDKEPWFGLYLRITAGWQIPIIHTQDSAETALCIVRICKQDAVAPAGPMRPRPRISAYGIGSVGMRMLLEIPGIGPKHASAVLSHFKRLDVIFSATPKELLEIHGIGKKRAEAILRANKVF